MPTCTTYNCTCRLSSNEGHCADDVVAVVAESMRCWRDDECPAPSGNWYAEAAAAVLAEGVDAWNVPARQQHRADAWRAACRAELRAYIGEAA